jgi:hypothetical protein
LCMLLSCCFHVGFQTLQKACFTRFLRMLLSCCFYVGFQTFQKPCGLQGFCACCFHVAFMLFPKRFKNLVFYQVFVHVAFMLLLCCFPNVSKTLCFTRFLKYHSFHHDNLLYIFKLFNYI